MAGSSAYPGYLQGASRHGASPSSRPTTGEGQTVAANQLLDAPFTAHLVPGDVAMVDRDHVSSSLAGQWRAHESRMSMNE
jgi:hypothetical protein